MPYYAWKGTGVGNRKRKGKLEAADERQVENFLRRLRITEYSIKEAPRAVTLIKPRVKPQDLTAFTRRLSAMLDAGLPLLRSLTALGNQEENPTFRHMLRDISGAVRSGGALSDSLRKYPEVFDELYCNLAASGEAAGLPDASLKRLAEYLEKSEKLRRKVKSALACPAAILFVALAVAFALLVFVIPVFEGFFSGLGGELPALTRGVVTLSRVLVENALWVGLCLLVLASALARCVKTGIGRKLTDAAGLKLPVFGDLWRKVAAARFSRTLATMLQAGVPIIDSLDIAAGAVGNEIIEAAVIEARAAMAEGRSLADPFLEAGVFPGLLTSMIAIGEEAGVLDSMLMTAADFYDDEVDAAVDAMTALIEPLLIVLLGVIIGALVIAIYLPIFTMAQAAG
jgi:type IV pilus assembly protein PilC